MIYFLLKGSSVKCVYFKSDSGQIFQTRPPNPLHSVSKNYVLYDSCCPCSYKQRSQIASSFRKLNSSREGFVINCLATKVENVAAHYCALLLPSLTCGAVRATKTSMASPCHNNGSDKRRPEPSKGDIIPQAARSCSPGAPGSVKF